MRGKRAQGGGQGIARGISRSKFRCLPRQHQRMQAARKAQG